MKLPQTFRNWTSLAGATIALISFSMIVFLFIISVLFERGGGSYLGLFIYIVLPVILVIGLILIPIGMLSKLRKARKKEIVEEKKWPYIDFNNFRHRNAFIVFAVGTAIFLLLSAVGSYEAFHYSESVEFCGTLCHTVMEPEYVAYQNSPHARVSCVQCHVGSGANWYVRSKLSGLYQVYAVTVGNYPRPIPTPITNLRPARETCETCHWPEKFYARQLVVEKHYLPDEQNSEWDIYLQMKTGPSYSALGLSEGCHWHINSDIIVEYKALDDNRQLIPWVKYTNKTTGDTYIYHSQDTVMTKAQLDDLETRVMDCMDCHNRPSHDYHTPEYFVNNAMTAGLIPKELPDIKTVAMDVLNEDFPTKDSAMTYIESEVAMYYEFMHEEIFNERREMVDQAIAGIKQEFNKNIFPYMKVNWKVYPNHIGHLEFNGCFRCHNDQHKTDKGEVISMDCNLCHTIIAQGRPDTLQVTSINNALEFIHPNDPNQGWKGKLCVECHKDLYQ
jgi:hypothetical protein